MVKRPKLRRRKTPRGNYVTWTEDMVRDLTGMWKTHTGSVIARYLTEFYEVIVSEASVLGKGKYMGLPNKSERGRPRTRPRKVRKIKIGGRRAA